MSAWRRIAIESFPERRSQIEDSRDIFSIYAMFFELLPLAVEAHKGQDTELLERIYKYAKWCWQQKRRSHHVYNAVAVAFYEHLADRPVTCQAIPHWLEPAIFGDMLPLFRTRMSIDDYHALLASYDKLKNTSFAAQDATDSAVSY